MYFKEIQGLRVVAALLVAVYHIWFQRVSGGVDAFFVISGFFLYRTLFKMGDPRFGDVLNYYRRTLARVAPSACVVIAATCIGFFLLGVDSLWSQQIKSAIAALFFVENWRLAVTGADYLAQGELPSPFQQMWALSVQMQLYMALPLGLFGLSEIRRGLNNQWSLPNSIIWAACLAFGYALFATWQNQPFAYFNTFARIWEFLAGVLLAIYLPSLVMSKGQARVLGYICLMVLVTFAALVPVGQSFPGLVALVPVLATAGIIAAASNGAGIVVLNARPIQALGNISFTFYLWHWPLLIGYRMMSGHDDVGLGPGLAVILIAAGLAFATYLIAERPYRQSRAATARPWLSMGASALIMVPAAVIVGMWAWIYVDHRDTAQNRLSTVLNEGSVSEVVPATIIAKFDLPQGYRNGCNQRFGSSDVIECVYGNSDGSNVIVLAGGSHSLHWLPALRAVARRDPSLKIVAMTKGNCPLTFSDVGIRLTERSICVDWSRNVVARINELRPAAVVTLLSSTRNGAIRDAGEQSGETIPEGFVQVWADLPDIPILALRDTARAPFDMVLCVDRTRSDCSFDYSEPHLRDVLFMADLPDTLYALDLTDTICPDRTCPGVQDGVMVYRDHSHFTATYARRLWPHFQSAFEEMGISGPE